MFLKLVIESETPSQTSETEYTTHLDSVLTEDKPLLDEREIPEPTGEWVIPETDYES